MYVLAGTTTLVLHVAVIGNHAPCHYDFMFPRRWHHARLRTEGPRTLPLGQGLWGMPSPPMLSAIAVCLSYLTVIELNKQPLMLFGSLWM